jgi:hypothetical protein
MSEEERKEKQYVYYFTMVTHYCDDRACTHALLSVLYVLSGNHGNLVNMAILL